MTPLENWKNWRGIGGPNLFLEFGLGREKGGQSIGEPQGPPKRFKCPVAGRGVYWSRFGGTGGPGRFSKAVLWRLYVDIRRKRYIVRRRALVYYTTSMKLSTVHHTRVKTSSRSECRQDFSTGEFCSVLLHHQNQTPGIPSPTGAVLAGKK